MSSDDLNKSRVPRGEQLPTEQQDYSKDEEDDNHVALKKNDSAGISVSLRKNVAIEDNLEKKSFDERSVNSELKTGSGKSHRTQLSNALAQQKPSEAYAGPFDNRTLFKIADTKELARAMKQYQPRSGLDMKRVIQSNRTRVRKYNDAIYFGEIFNEKRHGFGIVIMKDGTVYEGEFENDHKHGKGCDYMPNGSRYEGSYANGKPEGYGVFYWESGEIYEGEWKVGMKHGSGMWKGQRGESYMGEWKTGKQEGHGVFVWRNGDRYEGEFKDFLKHGHGTEKFSNGDYYVGNYRNGKPHGYGEYYWANGSQYKGMFKNGLRHGKGTWKSGSGKADEYDGEWMNDKKCGFGVFRWISGNYYEGDFFDDNRHGVGMMHWHDGSYYKGKWDKGIQHGEGELYIPGKELKIGIFENNVYVGPLKDDEEENEAPRFRASNQFKLDPIANRPREIDVYGTPGANKMLNGKNNNPYFSPNPVNRSINMLAKNTNQAFHNSPSKDVVLSVNRDVVSNSPESHRGNHLNQSIDYYGADRDTSWISDQTGHVERKKHKNRSLSSKKRKLSPLKRIPEEDGGTSSRMPKGCLLTPKEWARWCVYREKLGNEARKYADVSKPEVCYKIRQFISPPIWKPPGVVKLQAGKSELRDSPWAIIYPSQ